MNIRKVDMKESTPDLVEFEGDPVMRGGKSDKVIDFAVKNKLNWVTDKNEEFGGYLEDNKGGKYTLENSDYSGYVQSLGDLKKK